MYSFRSRQLDTFNRFMDTMHRLDMKAPVKYKTGWVNYVYEYVYIETMYEIL